MKDTRVEKNIENIILNTSMYDLILRGFALTEHNKPVSKGSEGEVYFYNDYVIKSYINAISDFNEDETIFKQYCKEMQKFKDMGVNLPTFYTWLVIKNNAYNGYPNVQKNKFLILEEKIKGTPICGGYLGEDFSVFEDFCGEQEFADLMAISRDNPLYNLPLLRKILENYLNSFIEVNEILESMPEKTLEKLVVDTFNMFLIGKYSEPDLFGANVFITPDKKDLMIIDNRLITRKCDNEEFLKRKALLEVFRIFETNDIALETIDEFDIKNQAPEVYEKLMLQIAKNNKTCKAAILKLSSVMKQICDDPAIINQETFKTFASRMREIFGKEYAQEIVSDTTKIFIPER